jgi:hypothetical protein
LEIIPTAPFPYPYRDATIEVTLQNGTTRVKAGQGKNEENSGKSRECDRKNAIRE